VWTFRLRKDVKWHDGEAFTADDVDFWLHTYYSSKLVPVNTIVQFLTLKGLSAYHEGKADRIAGVKVVDANTIQFSLDSPDPGLLPVLGTPGNFPLPKHSLKDIPLANLSKADYWTTKPVGTGPWKFVKWVPDQSVQLARNDNYWRGKPYIENVVFKYASDETAMALLEKGELDMLEEVSPTEVPRLKALPSVKVYDVPSVTNGWMYQLNYYTKKGIWRNPKARQALQYGVDTDGFIKSVMGGLGARFVSWFDGSPWAAPTLNRYKYDPAKAKQLLTEAGWDFDKQVMNIVYWPSTKARNDFFVVMQDNLRTIGVKTNIQILDTTVLQESYYRPDGWDIHQVGTGWTFEPSYNLRSFFHSKGSPSWVVSGWPFKDQPRPANIWGGTFTSDKVDKLIDDGETETDPAKRKPIYQQLDALINENLPIGLYIHPSLIVGTSSRLQGLDPVDYIAPGSYDIIGSDKWWLWPQK
jgi:peptide/nickel transport system substrate-binding protein